MDSYKRNRHSVYLLTYHVISALLPVPYPWKPSKNI